MQVKVLLHKASSGFFLPSFTFSTVKGHIDEPLAQLSDCPILYPQSLHDPAPSDTWDGGSQGKNTDSDHQGWALGTVKGGACHTTLEVELWKADHFG